MTGLTVGAHRKNLVTKQNVPAPALKSNSLVPDIAAPENYLHLLTNRRVGVVANQASLSNGRNIVDLLQERKIRVEGIIAPEHGFYGKTDGEKSSREEPYHDIQITETYQKSTKEIEQAISAFDLVVFDLPSSGVRFFTYTSTLHLIMEACAKQNKTLIVLDRPNPLGDFVDGPVRESQYQSFIGMHPLPLVSGLTNGELAQMINGEKWLTNGAQCKLKIIKAQNYSHKNIFWQTAAISPNLHSSLAIRAYPSLALFEGTAISVGRGTLSPFEIIGYPDPAFGRRIFQPVARSIFQTELLHRNKTCFGLTITPADISDRKLNLKFLLEYYRLANAKKIKFFTRPDRFDRLAGTAQLRQQIIAGKSETEIRATWQTDIAQYLKKRRKYLLYEDFTRQN